MLRVFFFQPFKHEVNRALKFRVVLAGFAGVYHFKQRGKVLFFLRGFVVDIADKGAVEKPFRLHPKILAGFLPVAFGVGDYGIYQLQNVFLAADIRKGVVTHGLFEIDCVQHFYSVPATL